MSISLCIPYIIFLTFLSQQSAISNSEWLYCNCLCQSTLADITSCFLFERKNMKKKQNHLHEQNTYINNPLLVTHVSNIVYFSQKANSTLQLWVQNSYALFPSSSRTGADFAFCLHMSNTEFRVNQEKVRVAQSHPLKKSVTDRGNSSARAYKFRLVQIIYYLILGMCRVS